MTLVMGCRSHRVAATARRRNRRQRQGAPGWPGTRRKIGPWRPSETATRRRHTVPLDAGCKSRRRLASANCSVCVECGSRPDRLGSTPAGSRTRRRRGDWRAGGGYRAGLSRERAARTRPMSACAVRRVKRSGSHRSGVDAQGRESLSDRVDRVTDTCTRHGWVIVRQAAPGFVVLA